MVYIRHIKPVFREQMVKPSGLCNSVWANFSQIFRQSLATVRHPSGYEVNPSWVRTYTCNVFFFLFRITLRRVSRCFHFNFHESVHILMFLDFAVVVDKIDPFSFPHDIYHIATVCDLCDPSHSFAIQITHRFIHMSIHC